MAPTLHLALLVAVLLALRCLQGDSATLRAVEGGSVQLECQLPPSSSVTPSNTEVLKQLRLTKSSSLVFERHGHFPASLGNGYFHRVALESLSPRRHRFNLTGLREADEGAYSCRVELENGESSTETHHLQLWLLPRFESNQSSSSTGFLRRHSGEYAVLRCPKFRGRPRPSVSWLLNERRLANRGRVRIDRQLPEQLHVYNLNANDSGRYACRIQNPYGADEFDFTLLVSSSDSDGAASIAFIHRPPPSQSTAAEGARLELPCGVYADPRLQFRVDWQRARTAGSSRHWSTLLPSSNPSIFLVKHNSSLVFQPLHHNHSGVYRCLVILSETNGSERQLTSRASTITVLHPPTLLPNASQAQFLPLGLAGSLTCPVTANPPIGATDWSRNKFQIGAAFDSSFYRLNLVTPSHAGIYRCRALQTDSKLSSWSAWTPEFVVRTVQPPRFVARPLPLYQLSLGESVRLPCDFWSPPDVPTGLIWLRNGQRLDYRDSRLAYDPLEHELSVRNVQPDLGGTYTCALDNPVRPLAASTRLLVELISPHPPFNLTVVSVTPYSLDLEWQPAFDAGLAVHYTVWYRRLGSAWKSQSADPPTATEATLVGVVADTVYELSLTSQSVGGSSVEMRVQPEVITVRTAGYLPRLENQPLPRDRAGRIWFPPIERDLGPRPSPPVATSFDVFIAGVLRVAWRPPTKTPIPVLYYRLEVNVWNGKDGNPNRGSWEEFTRVLQPHASLPIDSMPLLRVRTAEAAATRQRLRIAATSCALLSRSRRVVVADVDPSQLARLLPAGSLAAALASAGVNRVPAGAAWALLSCLLSFLVLAGALLGLTRSSGRHLGRRVVVTSAAVADGSKDNPRVKLLEEIKAAAAPSQRRGAESRQLRPGLRHHRCRSRRCCCRQQQPVSTGASSEDPALRSLMRRLDRPVSEPESGFQSPGRAAQDSRSDDDDENSAEADDDEVSVSDIESTLPPGSWQVHGWSRRLPISVYLASYHRIRRLRRASFPIYRESELL